MASVDSASSQTGARRRVRHIVSGLALIAWCGVFVTPKLLLHWSMRTHNFDTGIYSNLVWNIAHGNGFHSHVLGYNHLGEHFSVIVAVLAPFYRLGGGAEVLMVAQGLAAALAFVPLLFLGRRILDDLDGRSRLAWGGVLLVLFLFYQPFLRAWEFQFQPIALGMPLVGLALLTMHLGRWWWFALSVALLATTREAALLTMVGLGLYGWLVLGHWRVALTLWALALAGAVMIFGVIMPAYVEQWGHTSRLGVWSHPDGKAGYVLALFVGLGFLPLLGRRALLTSLAALPGIALNLIVDHPAQFSRNYHYDAHNAMFLFVAAIYGAHACHHWLGRLSAPRRDVVAVCIMVAMLGAGAALKGRTPFERFDRYWPTAEESALRQEARRVGALPADVALASDRRLGPYVAHRHRYVELREQRPYADRLERGDVIAISPESEGLIEALAEDERAAPIAGDFEQVSLYRWE